MGGKTVQRTASILLSFSHNFAEIRYDTHSFAVPQDYGEKSLISWFFRPNKTQLGVIVDHLLRPNDTLHLLCLHSAYTMYNAEILEEIIQNEVSLGGSPTIKVNLYI